MKIGPIFPQPTTIIISLNKEKEANLNSQVQSNPNQIVIDEMTRHISEINVPRSDKREDNQRAQALIEKFKSGIKLTVQEINYIQRHAPEMVEYIQRITFERENLELAMRSAPTKVDVHIIAFEASKQLKNQPGSEDVEVRSKHLTNALDEYKETDEYKEKPNHIHEKRTVVERSKDELRNYSIKLMLAAYIQNKQINNEEQLLKSNKRLEQD